MYVCNLCNVCNICMYVCMYVCLYARSHFGSRCNPAPCPRSSERGLGQWGEPWVCAFVSAGLERGSAGAVLPAVCPQPWHGRLPRRVVHRLFWPPLTSRPHLPFPPWATVPVQAASRPCRLHPSSDPDQPCTELSAAELPRCPLIYPALQIRRQGSRMCIFRPPCVNRVFLPRTHWLTQVV